MVYIVLVNFNGWQNTIECIDGLCKGDSQNFKIILVDNKSTNDSVSQLEKYIGGLNVSSAEYVCKCGFLANVDSEDNKTIVLLTNDVNNGFAAGCNSAFRYIRKQNDYKYVWLLGSDSIVEYDSIDKQIAYMETHKDVGLCGCISLSYYDKEKIQCAGLGIYDPILARAHHLGVDLPKEAVCSIDWQEHFDKPTKRYVYGNSMFFRKSFFDVMGDIPEDYFIYYEELEVMHKLIKENMKYGVATDCKIYHKEGASTGGTNAEKSYLADYYSVRNRILYTIRYHKLCLPTVYLGLCGAIVNRIRRKQYDRVWMILKLMINPYPKLNQ